MQSYISTFALSNLKNVKIIISSGMCMKEHLKWEYIKKLFRLSNFLLDKAVVLEKFVIVSNSRSCEMCGIKCVSRFLSRLANKLRSSANSVIIFQELVDVSSVDNAKDNPDQDSDEEDSCSEDHQDSDDEEDSCSDYFQDSDDEEDSFGDYFQDSDDEEDSYGDYYCCCQDSDVENSPDQDSDEEEEN